MRSRDGLGGRAIPKPRSPRGSPAFGIPTVSALAAVLVFRGITFAIPPIFGFFTLKWLRAQGYA